jgi:hypothetical protein
MFSSPALTLKAKVLQRCTWCAQDITPGEPYKRWVSVDDYMFTNKMHPECLASVIENEGSNFEYSPFEGERPPKETS